MRTGDFGCRVRKATWRLGPSGMPYRGEGGEGRGEGCSHESFVLTSRKSPSTGPSLRENMICQFTEKGVCYDKPGVLQGMLQKDTGVPFRRSPMPKACLLVVFFHILVGVLLASYTTVPKRCDLFDLLPLAEIHVQFSARELVFWSMCFVHRAWTCSCPFETSFLLELWPAHPRHLQIPVCCRIRVEIPELSYQRSPVFPSLTSHRHDFGRVFGGGTANGRHEPQPFSKHRDPVPFDGLLF